MKGKYNIMCFKSTLIGSFDYDNIYKVFMSLSLSGSKLITRVCGEWGIHPGMIYPLNSRYTAPGCGGRGYTPRSTVSDHKGTVKEKLINVVNQ